MTGNALRPAVSTPEPSVDRLRAICLALPEAVEKETWSDPTFRVRDRIFALVRQGDGRLSFWVQGPGGQSDGSRWSGSRPVFRAALCRAQGLGGRAA